jgi:hypothetical protein
MKFEFFLTLPLFYTVVYFSFSFLVLDLDPPDAEFDTIDKKSPDFNKNFIARFPSRGELSFLSLPYEI